jgi:hypothetical protein
MVAQFRKLWVQRRTLVVISVILLASSGLVLGAVRYSKRSPSVPTFEMKRTEFVDSLQFRGDVKASKSATISVPSEVDNIKILKIVADGTPVKPGDIVVEFDKTKTEQDVAQFRSTLASSQAEIEQARAAARLAEEEDQTALLKARYDVELAKLESGKQEIVSRIEGEEAKLKLADAEQKLHESEQKLQSDQAQHYATVESKVQASKKAVFDVQRAEHALTEMILRAPSAGIISLIQRWRPEGESPFKVGDRAWPGAAIAELPDATTLQIAARVDETERGRLALKQAVTVQMDAIPDRQFTGHIERIGTIASTDFAGGWPFPRNFDLQVVLDQRDSRLKPGLTTQLNVLVDRIPNALSIPVQALFQKSGQNVAYVWAGTRFEERRIDVGRRSGERILVVRGLSPGELVALKDPAVKE